MFLYQIRQVNNIITTRYRHNLPDSVPVLCLHTQVACAFNCYVHILMPRSKLPATTINFSSGVRSCWITYDVHFDSVVKLHYNIYSR